MTCRPVRLRFLLPLIVVSAIPLASDAAEPRLVRIAREIEPSLQGRPERLQQYISHFQRRLGNDPRLFAFRVNHQADESGTVRLSGHVEFSETRSGIAKFLTVLGFQHIENQVGTLPDPDLGAMKYGRVIASHSYSYDRPQEPRSVVTDCLMGEPLYLLLMEDGHFLAHSGEGYLGYVSADDVEPMDFDSFQSYLDARDVRVIADHTISPTSVIPAGALLVSESRDDEVYRCVLTDGKVVAIPSDKCRPALAPHAEIEHVIASGMELLGTPYVWGGKTSRGIDCSGLVQVAFSTAGLHLPRDSNQQQLLGQLVATRWHRNNLRRGDTLYFVGQNGRIRHTAIYLGAGRYLQAETPVVEISSLDPDDPEYDQRRADSFVFGKRLLH